MSRLAFFIVVFLPGMIASFFLRAFVLLVVWGWYVTPGFALESPTYLYCLGLVLLYDALKGRFKLGEKDPASTKRIPETEVPKKVNEKMIQKRIDEMARTVSYSVSDTLLSVFSTPLTVLLIAWVFHFFI